MTTSAKNDHSVQLIGFGAFILIAIGLSVLPSSSLEQAFLARAAGVLATCVMLYFVLKLPTSSRAIWSLFAAYLTATVMGDIIYDYQRFTMDHPPLPGPADVLYFSTYAAAIAGIALLAQRIDQKFKFQPIVDSLIIALVVLTQIHGFIIDPLIEKFGQLSPELLLLAAYPVLDVFLLVAVVRINMLLRWNNPAVLLLSAAMFIFFGLDLLYAFADENGFEIDLEIPWLLALTLMVLAAGLPSAHNISSLKSDDDDLGGPGLLTLVGLAAVLAPISALISIIFAASPRNVWSEAFEAFVMTLVLVRLYTLFQTIYQQHQALKRRAESEALARQEAVAAMQAAEAASIAKSQFLSVMSHELRTPLNAVMGMFQLIQRTSGDGKTVQFATRGLISSEHLLGLITHILDFSSVENGDLSVKPVPFRLSYLVADAKRATAERQKAGVEVVVTLSESLRNAEFMGDALRIKQVLINLLDNALKFTDAGRVVLSVSHVGGAANVAVLEFSVSDTGIGMTPEQLSRLFQPFTQLDMGNTRRFEGTGLGLAMSQRLVSLMGGEPITVESKAGSGSRFAFRLALPMVGNTE